MKDSKKIVAKRKLLEQLKVDQVTIKAILVKDRVEEKSENMESLRSWIAIATSADALLVSILVALNK